MMSLQEMGFVLAMAVIGGFHNILFAALGGVALQFLLELLREMGEWRLVVFGAIAIVMLRFAPNGVFGDRKSVVSGKSVSVRVDLGGRRLLKNKNTSTKSTTH